MSTASAKSSSTDEAGANAQQPASHRKLPGSKLKYLLLIAIVLIFAAGAFLSSSAPRVSDGLIWAYVACVLLLSFLFLRALFRRRWSEVAILCAMAPVVFYPYLGPDLSLRWIYVAGFRFHASPIEEYLSRCELVEFVEKGATQKVGVCESRGGSWNTVDVVIYDTTGELVLPVAQRTPEWTNAMGRFPPGKFVARSEGRAERLFGYFYDIEVGPEDLNDSP